MNKTILIIVVILIVIVGGYFLFKGGYKAPAPVSSPTPAPGITPGTVEEKVVSEGTEVKEFTISGTEYSFSPSSITVNAGDQVKVIFRNTGSVIHNFQISDLGVGTGTINPGQTDTIEFIASASGTYTFFCSVSSHRAAGMEGSLIVE